MPALPAPVLNSGISPTNDNPYLITGKATQNSTVDIYVEGIIQQQVTGSAIDGSFSVEVYLFDGINNIYAVENNGVDISPTSNTLQVTYNNIIDKNNLPTNITVDTVWTPGDVAQPYVITSELTIDAGASLIIQPGTEVTFESESYEGLVIKGKLIVAGTSQARVIFTPNQTDPTFYLWELISINDGGVAVIDYADIQNSNRAVYFHPGSNGSVTHSRIINNEYGIITEGDNTNVAKNPLITVTNNSVYGNDFGNYRASNYADNKNVILNANNNWWGTVDGYSIITGIDDYSFLRYWDYSPLIDISTILDGEDGDAYSHTVLSGLLQQSDVVLNGLYMLAGPLEVGAGQTLTVEAGNLIESGLYGTIQVAGTLNVIGTAQDKAIFTSINKSTPAENDWSGIYVADGGVVNIDYADIQYAGAAVHFQPGSNGSVTHSRLANNSFGIYAQGNLDGLYSTPGGTNPNAGNPLPIVTNNAIYDNFSWNYYTRWYENNNAVVLNANNNWWGTVDAELIVNKIHDYQEQPTHSPLVNISTILDSEEGNVYGGSPILHGRLLQPNQPLNGQYTLAGTLTVPAGETLTIEAGSRIESGATGEIIVRGTLNVVGTAQNRVVFTSNKASPSSSDWSGITVADGGVLNIDYAEVQYADKAVYFQPGSGGSITNSRLTYNKYAIYAKGNNNDVLKNPLPVVTNNSIYANQWNYYTLLYAENTNVSLNANNNWWGSVSVRSIISDIYDYQNNVSDSPFVDISSILDSEDGNVYGYTVLHTLSQANTTLNGTYILGGILNVGSGQTLTIGADSRIEVESYSGIAVDGVLNIVGTAQSRAVLTSNKAVPATYDWSGINVNDGGEVNIDYTDIQYADGAVYFLPGSSGTVTHSHLINNGYGIYARGDGAVAAKNPLPLVINNSIYNNLDWNYYANNYANNETVSLNANNNWWGSVDLGIVVNKIYDYGNNSSSSPLVDIGSILESEDGNVYSRMILHGRLSQPNVVLSGLYSLGGTLTVGAGENLIIQAGTHIESGNGSVINVKGTLNVTGTTQNRAVFTSNKAAPTIYDWTGINVDDGGVVNINYADIQYAQKGVNFQPGSSGTVTNSLIINNSDGIYVRGNNADPEKNPLPIVTNNSIYNNVGLNYTARNFVDNETVVLNANNNWWGSIDADVIVSKIEDYQDIPSQSPLVDFSSVLESESGDIYSYQILHALSQGDTTLDGLYALGGYFNIDSGKILTVGAGSRIESGSAGLINVQGTLNVAGTVQNHVVFTSNKTSPSTSDWSGISVADGGAVNINNANIQYANFGVRFYPGSGGSVIYSQLVNNTYGIFAEGNIVDAVKNPLPIIINNSIYNNTNYGYYARNYADNTNVILNATSNWWGASDISAVEAAIYDVNDYAPYGPTVDFSNFLTDASGTSSLDNSLLQTCPVVQITDDTNFIDSYPDDNIGWAGSNYTNVNEIERAFNHARLIDNSVFQYLKMPSQAVWDAMSTQEKGLYLINSERQARGIKPYEGLTPNVTTVAQNYADFIRTNNQVIGHNNDGNTPSQRLNGDPIIESNSSYAGESIFAGYSNVSTDHAVVQAVYWWTYYDKLPLLGSPWGHRDQILQTGLNEDSAATHMEGLLGIGVSIGSYEPSVNPPVKNGSIVVLNAIDPTSTWDQSTTQTVNIDAAQQCNNHVVISVDETAVPVAQIKTLKIEPSDIFLTPGATAQLKVIAIYQDNTQQDITSASSFTADDRSVVNIDAGTVTALRKGFVFASASANGVTSNSVRVSINEATNITNLNGTFADDYLTYVPTNASITEYDPKVFSLFTGKVTDKLGAPLADVTVSIHNRPDYGSVQTDINGQFIFAAEAGVQKIVYRKSNYLTIHRNTIAPSNTWTVVDDVMMLAVDSKETVIDLSSATPQRHKSTIITDAFGSRATTLVFNGVTAATILSTDGSQRTLNNFSVRATEYELPQSMPAALPKESAFTYCAELEILDVRDDEEVTFDNPVVMYVDNFLNFNVGEIVPIGYYDRNAGKWVASDNGVVVKLLDAANDGVVDGLDFTGDNIADDINQNGSTTDEVAGIENYPVGATYWRGSFKHFSPHDFNWSLIPPNNATSRGDFKAETSKEDKKQNELTCTGSYVKPETQSFHEDIPITGTNLTLHYSSQRTDGYKHKFNVQVSEASISPSMLEMIAKLEIGGQVFEQTFAPQTNKEAEFTWDGNDASGKRVKGVASGLISIGYKYKAEYRSSGAVATPSALTQSAAAWAKIGGTTTNIKGRDDFITWNSYPVSVQNTYGNQLANGWSLSNHHFTSAVGNIYKGDGEVIDAEQSSLVLKTGIKTTRHPGDDGFYQKGGSDIDYKVNAEGTLDDIVTGLKWEFTRNPAKFRNITDAVNYCTVAAFAQDRTGWRLPTFKEIVYTIDKSGSRQNNPVYQFGLLDNWNPLTINTGNALIPVICVKGEILDTRYVADLVRDNTSEVVVDAKSGLMWQDNSETVSVTKNWTGAIDYCENLNYVGYSDWRLPNINELAYALPNAVFVNETALPSSGSWSPTASFRKPYWSSTPNSQAVSQAWAMESIGLTSYDFSDTDSYNVRCVRDNVQAAKSSYKFNKYGQHTETVDLNTGTSLSTFDYDVDGKLRTITDRFNDAIMITGDPAINGYYLITTQDGYTTKLNIDSNNDLTSVVYDDNTSYTFAYDTGSLLTSKTTPNGNVFLHQFDLDGNGRTIQTSDEEGGLWNFFSTRQGNSSALYGYNTAETNTYQTLRTILANGDTNKVTTLFDGTQLISLTQANDLKDTLQSCGVTTVVDKVIDSKTKQPIPGTITITQPNGLQSITAISKTYAESGADTTKQTLTVNLNGKTSSVFTDTTSGVTITTSAENRSTTLTVDPATLLLQSSQTTGLLDTSYTYDTRGRQKTIITGTRTTAFTYGPTGKGDVTVITADDGKQTQFEYDALGRVSAIVYPDGNRTENTYDNNGNLTRLVIPTPANHDSTYNSVNKVKNETTPKDGVITEITQYDYDTEKNLTQITLPSTKVITNTYTNGQLDFTTTPEGVIDYSYTCNSKVAGIIEGSESISYGYDGSLLTSITYSGALNTNISQTYNNDFNIQSLTYAGQTSNITYDKDGLLTGTNGYTLTRNAQNGLPETLADGTLLQTRSFNGYGEADTVTTKVNNKNVYNYTLTYNDLGKITNKTETLDDGTVNTYVYIYDNRRRLDTVTKNGSLIEDYGYDANGNRTLQTNTSRSISNQSASYNLGDQLTSNGSTTYEYDADGYLSKKTDTAGITTYQYTSQGRLLQVVTPTKTISYKHNALGNRVEKQVDGVVTEKYLWLDKTTLLATYDATDTLLQRYQYTDGNTPNSFTQSGQTYYIVTDHLGSPRAITDSAGTIVKKLDYDAFGNIISDSNPTLEIPFGFAGGLYDKDTGLTRFGFRDYDSDTGRWTARDPIGFSGGDTNLYGYTANDPVNFIDQDGLLPSVPQGVVNFFAGLGDGLLLGLGDNLRELAGVDGAVNECSASYKAGGIASFGAGGLRLLYAGLAKVGSKLAASGLAASAFRSKLKNNFRLGVGKNWRKPDLSGKSGAQLRISAGKTNTGVNLYGAGVTAAGANGGFGQNGN